MARYTHYFNVCISNSFESDIEDFDDAFDEFIDGFEDIDAKRRELLHTDESTTSLMKGIIYNQTDDHQPPCDPKVYYNDAASIKEAVDKGIIVYCDSDAYVVIKDSIGQYLIKYIYSEYCIGLTWKDGTTLNGLSFYSLKLPEQ